MNMDKLEMFLYLKDFDEYMEKYELFCGLSMGKETFRKEMELMEKDHSYTHREKDLIRERRKREILKKLHGEIDRIRKKVEQEGVWITPMEDQESIEIRYRYPDKKKGDITHYLAGLYQETKQLSENEYLARFPASAFTTIELLTLPGKNLFTGYEYDDSDEAMSFLLKYNRIAQIERVMYQINYYKPEYRSMRSIPDLALKNLLQNYHRQLNKKWAEIYENLIQNGRTNARWISEQKAFAIVKKYYPDAKFQYQPEYLYGQRLDIFIPSKKTAIEYQGKQHYEPVEYFGGISGYESNRERDRRKKWRCRENGIRLFYWDYRQPLTEEYFLKELIPQIEG